MIGWYVHSHGRGHLHRLQCIAAHLQTPVTGLSSLPTPQGFEGAWLDLADDLPRGEDREPAAGGTLHWAPVHHDGLRARAAALAAWVDRTAPDLVVVDVSVEVAVLVRTMGVPVVVVAMRGDRSDRAHRTAYDLADALLAPWPASLAEPWPRPWLEKTWHVGALSRFDRRPVLPAPGGRRVTVLWGSGGSDVTPDDLLAAQLASPDWTWDVRGLPGTPWDPDPWPALQAADVIVTHAGQNAVAEVAAARRPAVVVPQARPHDEQHATAGALSRGGLASVEQVWPAPARWPQLLDDAAATGGDGWVRWSDGGGAQRAATHLDALARAHRERRACAPR